MALELFFVLTSLLCLFTRSSTENTGFLAPTNSEPHEYYRICPLPRCKNCPSVEELRAPGVGFALETSHGTAAVRLHDGTFHNIALIEGDASYNALMRQLATGPMDRTPDDSDDLWEILKYLKFRAQRLLNKFIGRPATPETAVLGQMVSKLLNATQAWLGDDQAVVAAVLSSPDRIRLTDEEIGDVFDFLRLRNLMDGPLSLYQLYATSATYAGYGKGLCRIYTDAYACEREEFEFPDRRALHLDLNFETLSGNIDSLKTAKEGPADASFVDFDLGLGHEGDDNGQQYWTAVSNRIRELARSFEDRVYMPHVTELLLTGPSAANERFRAAIRAALHDLVADENVLAPLEDRTETADDRGEWQSFFSFATARGAAEIAKRRQEGPVNCAQSDECRRRREEVHDGGRTILSKQRPDWGLD